MPVLLAEPLVDAPVSLDTVSVAAASGNVSPLWHPEIVNTVATSKTLRALFMGGSPQNRNLKETMVTRIRQRNHSGSGPRVRAPDGFADVAADRCDLLLNAAAVGRDGREHAASAVARRVNELRAVRGVTRRFVEPAGGEHVEHAARRGDDADPVGVVLPVHHGDLLAVRRDA